MENLNHLALFCSVSLLILYTVPVSDALKTLEERIYVTFNASIPCFRLTDARHQIGCSASSTNTRGVLHYVDSNDQLDWLVDKGPHGPYVALLEPGIFSSPNVRRLKSSSRVNGIIVRYEGSNATIPQGLEGFSPERQCPNAGYGFGDDSCDEPWNLNGTSLAFSDFGDFPVFALQNENFEDVLKCFSRHNSNGSGTIGDYPLCSVELTADMYAVRDTVTCFRRAEKVLTLLANDEALCDPLGDDNVWGTLFPVTEPQDNSIILLTTKIDSTAFFPALAHGANNELAGIATLLAVLEQLGKLKKDGTITDTRRPIMYAFFHGESWDYIGSSRMVYDMERGEFPGFDPPLMMKHIGDYLELSQLGIQSTTTDLPTFYVHSTVTSDIVESLNSTATTSGRITLKPSTNTCYKGKQPCRYPPASLQRFLRKNSGFNGSVLADFDTHYNYLFFGSRFDSRSVFAGDTTFNDTAYDQTIQNLANLATVIANTLLGEDVADPVWSASPQNVTANADTIRQVIDCFLVDAGCDLFQTVFIRNLADPLLALSEPPGRYITVDTQSNLETALIFQMVAYFTGVNLTDRSEVISCKECLQQMEGKTYNISWMQGPGSNTSENCLCLNSSTFFHIAKSPAFELKDYNSHEYSTWAESRWTAVSLRMYLITYPLQEAALLLCGLAMTLLSLLIGVQCNRKGRKIFEPNPVFPVQ